MVTCYLDESAVNRGSSSPVAVVAGLLLDHEHLLWMDLAWSKAIEKHLPGRLFIHMKDFGCDGELSDLDPDVRSALFKDLVKIIRGHKFVSIEATLSHAQYQAHFSFLNKKENRSIHGVCFMATAVYIRKWSVAHGCAYDIPYMLDDGCPDRKDIDETHAYMVNEFSKRYDDLSFGALAWGDDEKIPALQAADVIAWTVRRKKSGDRFLAGFEPLEELFDEHHLEQHFEETWMEEIASSLKAKLGR